MCFLGKVICSQSGLVHLVICRLKGLCCLTSKIAIAIARLGTRSNTFTESFAKNPLQETRPSFHWDSVPAATDAYPSPESMPKSLLSERCEVISSQISIAKRENVPPSFGPRPRGCKNGLLQPLWRNWYKYKQQIIKFVKRVGNDAIQYKILSIIQKCFGNLSHLPFLPFTYLIIGRFLQEKLEAQNGFHHAMSFASIQDCTPSTATHMSTAPCGSRNEAIRVIAIGISGIWEICRSFE